MDGELCDNAPPQDEKIRLLAASSRPCAQKDVQDQDRHSILQKVKYPSGRHWHDVSSAPRIIMGRGGANHSALQFHFLPASMAQRGSSVQAFWHNLAESSLSSWKRFSHCPAQPSLQRVQSELAKRSSPTRNLL